MQLFQSAILEIILTFILSTWGHTQPNNYGGGYHYSQPVAPLPDTGNFRPHHPREGGEIESVSGSSGHRHYVPTKPPLNSNSPKEPSPILTHDRNLLHDKEHLKEDMGDWLFKDGKEMSPEEMEFHYFKTHDFDNNSMLDGLEILQAISHILPMTEVETDITGTGGGSSHHHHQGENPGLENTGGVGTGARRQLTETERAEMKKQREEDFNYYVDLIDKVLEEDDLNKDGYLSYLEYAIGRRREEEHQRKQAVPKQFS